MSLSLKDKFSLHSRLLKRYVVYVAYSQKYKELISFLSSNKGINHTIVVDNSPDGINIPQENATMVKGSNVHNEFSGWQEGLNILVNNFDVSASDEVVFANDTFFAHHKITDIVLNRFISFDVNGKAVGFLSSFNNDFAIYGLTSDSWLSTFAFKLNFCAIESINFKIDYFDEMDGLIEEEFPKNHKYLNLASGELENHLYAWLHDGGWYKSKALTKENYSFFRMKALCILNEKFLSLILTERGIRLIDVRSSNPILMIIDLFLRRLNLHIKK